MSRDSGLYRSPRFIVSVTTVSRVSLNTYGCNAVARGAFMVDTSFDRGCRLRPFTQRELLDLSRRRLRQVPKHDPFRRLEVRQVFAAMGNQIGLGHDHIGLD